MHEDPTASVIAVLEFFVASVIYIQERLWNSYQGDLYLRHRLQEAIGLPALQDFIKDRPANYSQELVNRVLTKLSDRPKTAGAVSVNWATRKKV